MVVKIILHFFSHNLLPMHPFLMKFERHSQLHILHTILKYILPAAIPFNDDSAPHYTSALCTEIMKSLFEYTAKFYEFTRTSPSTQTICSRKRVSQHIYASRLVNVKVLHFSSAFSIQFGYRHTSNLTCLDFLFFKI